MFIVEDYFLAVVFCFITMICWGSWANTQKLADGKWQYELFYWDYVIGICLFSLTAAFTLGSQGSNGRSFLNDIAQVRWGNVVSAFTGGIIFNLANILLTTAIAVSGMAVAFPIGIGIALILGVVVNFFLVAKGSPALLFAGVVLVAAAIILNALAYRKSAGSQPRAGIKGIGIAIVAGILMSFFYRFVAAGMDLSNFASPETGKMTPYTASVIFAIGILASNLLFNTLMMKRPITGSPSTYADYFKGRLGLHLIGLSGGAIWALGNLFNLLAAGKAGPAVSYGLGQGATLVAAVWGVLIWKEFKSAPHGVIRLITAMFIFFIAGIGLIIAAGSS